MERRINRRQQGDLGEASAIDWLTRRGVTVSVPLGHSPDYDLIAEFRGEILRVQVKTSTCRQTTSESGVRWEVSIQTNGGNQSWSGVAKRFDPIRADLLYVLVGDGRRWLIPASAVEGLGHLSLGGRKYSEFEIEGAEAIVPLVYKTQDAGPTIDDPVSGERRSGRVGLDCKSSASLLSGFESHLPHHRSRPENARRERPLGRAGQAIIREKRQMTMPLRPFSEAGLEIGDRLRFRADGAGRVVIERIEPGGHSVFLLGRCLPELSVTRRRSPDF